MKLNSKLLACMLSTVGAAACSGVPSTGAPDEILAKKSALTTMGLCVVPKSVSSALSLGHKTINAGTSSATAGDSLLPANNVALGNYPAGTTIIVGFTGLGQNTANGSGDTLIRLSDDSGPVATGDDACGGLASRIVYTVPHGNRNLTVRLGCFGSGACAGDLMMWTRYDSNGQLTNVLNAHAAIITGSNANGSPSAGTLGGTSVRLLTDQTDWAPHYGSPKDMIAPTQDGSHGYINNSVPAWSHFEGVQRLRTETDTVAVSGSYRADVMFGFTGLTSSYPTADLTWLQAGATSRGWMESRYSNYDVPAPAPDATVVTQFNHFGGIQTAGEYIVGGMSNYPNPQTGSWGRLALLDVNYTDNVGTSGTMRKWMLDPEVMSGCTAGIGPSQVGITKLQNGTIVMAMSRGDEHYFDFYVKTIDEADTVLTASNTAAGFADIEDGTFGTPSKPNPKGWTVMNGTGGVYVGPQDQSNIALVTQTDGKVFLLESTWNSSKDLSTSWVQQVNANIDQAGVPHAPFTIGSILETNNGYQCAGGSVGCNFIGASGFYINSFDDSLQLYSTNQYLNWDSPPTLGVSEFASNLAFKKPVNPSSASATNPPSNLDDGNWANAAMTNSSPFPFMWVDLGAAKTVTGVKVVACAASFGCPTLSDYTIYNWNGSTWVSQFHHTSAMSAGSAESLAFPSAIHTEFVLIEANATTALGVAEMQVY